MSIISNNQKQAKDLASGGMHKAEVHPYRGNTAQQTAGMSHHYMEEPDWI